MSQADMVWKTYKEAQLSARDGSGDVDLKGDDVADAMIRVKLFEMTCGACPSQWEGVTDDNRTIYARYRWGHLSVYVSDVGEDISNAFENDTVYSEQLGNEFDGTMSTDELMLHTSGIISWR